jgi:uncharacterized protein YggU (UPF0235/DUF167 family)
MAKEIRVRVVPNSRRESVAQGKGDVLEVRVREKAERGEANARVRQLVALHVGVPLSKVRILAGQRSPTKRFSIG